MSNVVSDVIDNSFEVVRCEGSAVYTVVSSPLRKNLSPRDYTKTSNAQVLDARGHVLFGGPCWLPNDVASDSAIEEGVTQVVAFDVGAPLTIMSTDNVLTFTQHSPDISEEALDMVKLIVPSTHAAVLSSCVPDVSGAVASLNSVHIRKASVSAEKRVEITQDVNISFGSESSDHDVVDQVLQSRHFAGASKQVAKAVSSVETAGSKDVAPHISKGVIMKSKPAALPRVTVPTQRASDYVTAVKTGAASIVPSKIVVPRAHESDKARVLPVKGPLDVASVSTYMIRAKSVKLQLLGYDTTVGVHFDFESTQSFASTYVLSHLLKLCKSNTLMSYDSIKGIHTQEAVKQSQVGTELGEALLDMMSYPVLTVSDIISATRFLGYTKKQMDVHPEVIALANFVLGNAMRKRDRNFSLPVAGTTLDEVICSYISICTVAKKIEPVLAAAKPGDSLTFTKESVVWTLVSKKLMVFTSTSGTLGVMTNGDGTTAVTLLPTILSTIKCVGTFRGYAAFLVEYDIGETDVQNPELVLDAFLSLV